MRHLFGRKAVPNTEPKYLPISCCYVVGCVVLCNPDNPDGANLVFKCVCKLCYHNPPLPSTSPSCHYEITMFVQSSDWLRLYEL